MARRQGSVSIRRKRDTLDGVFEVTFRDPRRWQDPKDPSKGRRVVRKSLRTNDLGLAQKYQADLERLISDRSLWKVPPGEIALVVREIWLGARADVAVATKHGEVRLPWSSEVSRPTTFKVNAPEDFTPVADDDGEWPGLIGVELPYPEAAKTLTVAEAYKLAVAELDELRKAYERQAADLRDLKDEKAALELKLRRYNKRAAKAAKVGTLAQEAEKYLADYYARKVSRKRHGIMRSTINRFVQDMGKDRKADDISEAEVSRYVHSYRDANGKAVGEERRKGIRLTVATFLEQVTDGVFDRKRVSRVSSHSVEREKRNPVFLEVAETTALLKKMQDLYGDYWHDFAAVQLYMGWRPTEIALLQKEHVTETHVELVPVKDESTGVWYAKTGRRIVQIHPQVAEVVQRRVEQAEGTLLFPFPRKLTAKGKPKRRRTTAKGLLEEAWDQGVLSKVYLVQLRSAAKAAKIKKKVDSRTLRRTFGSLAIRSGISVEAVATIMGNRPQIVRKHYARLLPSEVSLDGITFTTAGGGE
ncbi:MAG: site-specific integrase [Planctomycetes bacterium]|nr:site-specific integrase [Planctomycetota bacterium]MCW8135929.1 site-specific integrase [Planctomycetota bacterium]